MNETSEVALKLLAAADEHQLKQFRREIAMLRSLSEHDGVVQVCAPAAVPADSIHYLEFAALLWLGHGMVIQCCACSLIQQLADRMATFTKCPPGRTMANGLQDSISMGRPMPLLPSAPE